MLENSRKKNNMLQSHESLQCDMICLVGCLCNDSMMVAVMVLVASGVSREARPIPKKCLHHVVYGNVKPSMSLEYTALCRVLWTFFTTGI